MAFLFMIILFSLCFRMYFSSIHVLISSLYYDIHQELLHQESQSIVQALHKCHHFYLMPNACINLLGYVFMSCFCCCICIPYPFSHLLQQYLTCEILGAMKQECIIFIETQLNRLLQEYQQLLFCRNVSSLLIYLIFLILIK